MFPWRHLGESFQSRKTLKNGADDQQIWMSNSDVCLTQKTDVRLMTPVRGCPVVVQFEFGVADQGQQLVEAEWK
jgi:hypothetical protein